MLIDWFTVIAQAINFLILVWLMKRFLYKPIQGAIDAREKRIATELANADQKEINAQKESAEFRLKNQKFDEQRAALLAKAKEEIGLERERLLADAQKAAVALTLKRQETLKNEEHNLHHSIIHRIQQEVFAITKKLLTDLAETSLEERMVDLFIRRLRGEKEQLTAAIGGTSSPVIVRTTIDLSKAQRAGVEGAIKETLGTQTGSKHRSVRLCVAKVSPLLPHCNLSARSRRDGNSAFG